MLINSIIEKKIEKKIHYNFNSYVWVLRLQGYFYFLDVSILPKFEHAFAFTKKPRGGEGGIKILASENPEVQEAVSSAVQGRQPGLLLSE